MMRLMFCTAVCVVAMANWVGATVPIPPERGTLDVKLWDGVAWQLESRLVFGNQLDQLTVTIPGDGKRLRLVRRGPTTAHVDVVTMDGHGPVEAAEANNAGVAARKLEAADLDVLHLGPGQWVDLVFPESTDGMLRVTARLEPRIVRGAPFLYPPANQFTSAKGLHQFYTYRLGSRIGNNAVDDILDDDSLGEPLFAQLSCPTTGHPVGTTLAWVRNDDRTLYAALDFQSDNTWDDGADFAALHVRTDAGVRSFRVSQRETDWGRSGFAYTDSVPYQHAVYEFAIPFEEIGLAEGSFDTEIGIAFEAYGTAVIGPRIDLFDYPPAGQTAAGSCTIASDGVEGTILGTHRELGTSDPGITATANAGATPGLLTADFSSTAGSVQLVWDGDTDCSTLATFLVDFGLFDRVTLVRTNNSGTGPIDAVVRILAEDGVSAKAANTYTSPTVIIPVGATNDHFQFLFDDFTPALVGQARIEILRIELELTAAVAGGVITIDRFVPSNGAVPVELQAFVLE